MKIIKELVKKIEDELHDAEDYAKLAFSSHAEFPEVSEVFLTISRQESSHANMLHNQAERMIKDYMSAGGKAPENMRGVWEWEHDKMIDTMARVRAMQDSIR